MSYYHCGNGHHALDDYVCLCKCHGEWYEKGRRPRAYEYLREWTVEGEQ